MTSPADVGVVERLRKAATEFNTVEMQKTCAQFILAVRQRNVPVDAATALQVLKILQSKRQISLVHGVAEALLAHGVDSVEVRHRYALALLDYDRTAVAESLLRTLPKGARMDPEVTGAIGRVHKQRYLTSGPAAGRQRTTDLRKAIEAYEATYRLDPRKHYYHGINTATLLARAAGDHVSVPRHRDPLAEARVIAKDLLTKIKRRRSPGVWELATAAEACLVLGRDDDAVAWTCRYVDYLGPDANAFEYASTLRQFQLAWRLDAHSEPGVRLLPLLRGRLLQAEGGAIYVDPSEFTPESLKRFERVDDFMRDRSDIDYEKVFGSERFRSPKWLREALDKCRSVALIEDKYEDGQGTGFVLAGKLLRPEWPDRVLLTNAHVVPEALGPDKAHIVFRGLDGDESGAGHVDPVGSTLWESPRNEFDACILPLPDDLSDQVRAMPLRAKFPSLDTEPPPRAYVIGYPKGSPNIQVSLHDTRLLSADERYAHYRSPTEQGNSGSPVFDSEWQVIALHHGAVDAFRGSGQAANEGIRLDKLVDAMRT